MSVSADIKRELSRVVWPAAGAERSLGVRTAWFFVNTAVVHNRFNPFSALRVIALRTFGAEVGRGVIVKPGVRVKFPWKLKVGDRAAIGEDAWIDNIAPVEIGAHAVVSQGAYLCTGNHDWRKADMPLTAKPIVVGERAWVGARAVIAPGVTVGRNALVRLGSVVTQDVPERPDADRGV